MNKKKLLAKALSSPNNLHFADLATLAQAFGFVLSRTEGSHQIYTLPGTSLRLNFQNVRGKAKPYQVRQLLKFVEEYNLRLESDT
jgi:hypothetical protein